MADGRDNKGRFTQGNPGGGRPRLPKAFHETLKANAQDALDTVISIMRDEKNKPELRFKAACFIIDHSYGSGLKEAQSEDVKEQDLRARIAFKETDKKAAKILNDPFSFVDITDEMKLGIIEAQSQMA